jgi:hypothetical protein
VRKIIAVLVTMLMIFMSISANSSKLSMTNESVSDFDPLVDITVNVEIQQLRFLEDKGNTPPKTRFLLGLQNLFSSSSLSNHEIINDESNFYVKIFINNQQFTSPIWNNQRSVYNIDWIASYNVPDDVEFVEIKIQLWNSKPENNILYDISPDYEGVEDMYDAEIEYSIKTGHWNGDDYLKDPSGYGRLSGCDDGTVYDEDRDSELWFDIYQNDYDNDNIPYWTEVNVYQTDPEVSDTGDPDNDDIPVEWEYKWGYHPFNEENHKFSDEDEDSIDNVEEYLTSEWFSDPFRKDVFVEMDIMEEGPNGEITELPEGAKELIKNAFDRQNVVYHLDDGEMGGHELLPFQDVSGWGDCRDMYEEYFLHGNESIWKRGVFHYGLVVYNSYPTGYIFRDNAYQIGYKNLNDEKSNNIFFGGRDIVFGSAYMHELGHTFNFRPIPGHNQMSSSPFKIGYWLNRPYKSIMNYAWMYHFVDYSNGTGRSPDLNDWARIDYDSFERD